MTAPSSLEGGHVALLGAASDMGLGLARAFADAGARVFMADVDEGRLDAHAATLRSDGHDVDTQRVDVTDADAVDEFIVRADGSDGALRASIHLAGVIDDIAVVDLTEGDLDRILSVNLKGVVFACQSAGRRLALNGGGAIVNMASMGAFTPIPKLAGYSMSKAAVVALTRTLALELAPEGVRVNAVAPGYIEGGMTRRHLKQQDGEIDEQALADALAKARRRNPLGLTGRPEDVASACLYLASDTARYVTGQVLHLNGGAFMP